jgi:hypothetical protein
MYRKMEGTIHSSPACIQPPFSGEPSAPFERGQEIVSLETKLRFSIYIYTNINGVSHSLFEI